MRYSVHLKLEKIFVNLVSAVYLIRLPISSDHEEEEEEGEEEEIATTDDASCYFHNYKISANKKDVTIQSKYNTRMLIQKQSKLGTIKIYLSFA